MPTLTTPTPLAQAATYRGAAAGWVPLGDPRPLAQAQALAALAARVRPHYLTRARPVAPAPVAPTPGRRWPAPLSRDAAETCRGLAIIAAAYGAVVLTLVTLGQAYQLAAPTPATPAATLAR